MRYQQELIPLRIEICENLFLGMIRKINHWKETRRDIVTSLFVLIFSFFYSHKNTFIYRNTFCTIRKPFLKHICIHACKSLFCTTYRQGQFNVLYTLGLANFSIPISGNLCLPEALMHRRIAILSLECLQLFLLMKRVF